jgi:hypothetical protein
MGGEPPESKSLWLFPLCQTTPPSDQVEPGKSLPSVKLKNPNLPSFWDGANQPQTNIKENSSRKRCSLEIKGLRVKTFLHPLTVRWMFD